MIRKKLPKRILLTYSALLLTTIIWGAAVPIIKLTLLYIPTFTFLFYRFLIVCVVLLPFVIVHLKRNPIDKHDYLNFIMLGVAAQSSLALLFEGLKYTSAMDAALLGVLSPLLSVAAGHYYFREKVDKNIKLGVLIATLGTIFIVLEPLITDGGNTHDILLRILGNSLVLLANLLLLLYTIWSKVSFGARSREFKKTLSFIHLKPLRKKYSAFILASMNFYVAFVSFIPFVILENLGIINSSHAFDTNHLTFMPIAGILYLALVSSITAYMIYQWALESASIGDTAFFSYLGPVFTAPFAYLFLKELVTPVLIIGSLIITAGVLIAEKERIT